MKNGIAVGLAPDGVGQLDTELSISWPAMTFDEGNDAAVVEPADRDAVDAVASVAQGPARTSVRGWPAPRSLSR